MLQLSEATALRIKELMRKRSLTQYALAKKSGLSPSTLNTILAGKTPGRIDMMILNICRGLEIFNIIMSILPGVFQYHHDIEYLPGLRD